MANGRTGQVFLEDFDRGLAETIGAELINIELDGEEVQAYAVRIPGVEGPAKFNGLVPIIMSDPEEGYTSSYLPQIVFSRAALTPDMARWFPGGREYMVPAHNAEEVVSSGGLKGPSRVEIKNWSLPYEWTYDVHCRAKTRTTADRMLRYVGAIFWKYGQIWLKDSEGEERGYYAFQESVDALGELGDVAERLHGWTFSLRVEGELDFFEPFVAPTTPKLSVRVLTASRRT